MKKLELKNLRYQDYEEDFTKWLYRMGASTSSKRDMPIQVRELLHFMEGRRIDQIEKIGVKDIRDYFAYLSTRPNQKTQGKLSTGHYNRHLNSIKKFSHYLWHQCRIWLPIHIKNKPDQRKRRIILTLPEVESLYEATQRNRLLELRDQTILDIYYSCGLRRAEGRQVKLSDINLERRVLYVAHGKNYTWRYVPFTNRVALRLKSYIHYGRPFLTNDVKHQGLIISRRGDQMSGMAIYSRVAALQRCSTLPALQDKTIGLHTLRHSIATHLMRGGMSIYQIALFLGHASVRSTQIYTHLSAEMDMKEGLASAMSNEGLPKT